MNRMFGTFMLLIAISSFAGSVARADLGDCLQPASTGSSATVRDCLYVLQAGLGARTCEPRCICDANADDSIDATDALVCLRSVIGLPSSELCTSCGTPAGPFTTV